jgi:hypothetical protein
MDPVEHSGRGVGGQRRIRRLVGDRAAGAERQRYRDRKEVRRARRHGQDYAGCDRRLAK